jgi:hypothetical protein
MKVIVIGQPTEESQKAILEVQDILKDIEFVHLATLTAEDIKNLSNVPQSELIAAYERFSTQFSQFREELSEIPRDIDEEFIKKLETIGNSFCLPVCSPLQSNDPQNEIRNAYAEAITNFDKRHPSITTMPKIDKPLVYSDQHKKGRRGRKGNKTKKYFKHSIKKFTHGK